SQIQVTKPQLFHLYRFLYRNMDGHRSICRRGAILCMSKDLSVISARKADGVQFSDGSFLLIRLPLMPKPKLLLPPEKNPA
ncbi:MAG TPA: hypothetical protein VF780_02320, partial [Nitrosospira sp.]